jgi:hypothetical protein
MSGTPWRPNDLDTFDEAEIDVAGLSERVPCGAGGLSFVHMNFVLGLKDHSRFAVDLLADVQEVGVCGWGVIVAE